MPIEERLKRLERSNCRWAAAVAALTAFTVVGHAGGSMRRPGIVQATELEFVDQGGIERGNWTVSEDDNPFLAMRNRNGEVRLIVSATSENRAVHFFGDEEKHAGSIFGKDVTRTIEEADRVKVGN